MRRNPYMPPARVLRLASASLTERQQTALAEYQSTYTRAVEAVVKPQAREQASRMGLRALGPDDTLPTPPVDYTDALARAADTGSRVAAMGERAGESRERQLAAAGRATAVSLLNSGVPRDLVAEWAADPEVHRLVGIDDPREAAGWAVAVGVTFAGMTGPAAVEEGTGDDFADLMDAVRGMERQHTTYTYDGLEFRLGTSPAPGVLAFQHGVRGYEPAVLTAPTKFGWEGRVLEESGWSAPRRLLGTWHGDKPLRGAQTGVQPYTQTQIPGVGDDPVAYLERHRKYLREKRERKEAEKAAEARRAAEETRKVGPWFADVMAEAAKEAGWGESYIPDTVEAAVVRKVLAKYGIKASIKVRRYSMASGLDVSKLDEQDAKDAAAIFPYTERAFRSGTGIYPHKHFVGAGGFRVAPQYVPVVKQIAVEELRKALAKAKAKADPVADPENVPAKAGDLIVRFGFYTGDSVYDVVVVEHPVYGGQRGVKGHQATVELLTSQTFRRKRYITVDVGTAKTYGMAVGSPPDGAGEDKALRSAPAPRFTPKRIMADPAGSVEAVLASVGIFPNPGTRVLWANTYSFTESTQTSDGWQTQIHGFLMPGHDRIKGRSVSEVVGAPVASSRKSKPKAKAAPVADAPGWALRYVKAPKAGGSWWNVGAVDPDGKNMRYGYNPDEDRWARNQVPPVRVIQAAMAEGLPFSS